MNFRATLVLFFATIVTGSCDGETFHVDNEADLRNRLSMAAPGDRIVLAKGTYVLENVLNVQGIGTEAMPITLTTKGLAILDGAKIVESNPAPLKFNGAMHWVVENITCRNSNNAGISINDSRFIKFVNSNCHSNNGSGFDAYRSPDLTFLRCAAWNNFDTDTNGQN